MLYADGLNHYDDGPGRDTPRRVAHARRLCAACVAQVTSNWTTQLRYRAQRRRHPRHRGCAVNFPGLFETDAEPVTLAERHRHADRHGAGRAGAPRTEVDSDTRLHRHRSRHRLRLRRPQRQRRRAQLAVQRAPRQQFAVRRQRHLVRRLRLIASRRTGGVNVSHGTRFVAPSFNQLYFPGFGNPALQPEAGKNTDWASPGRRTGREVKLVRYDNKIRGFMTNTTLPVNIPHARDRWLDAGLPARIRRAGPASLGRQRWTRQ